VYLFYVDESGDVGRKPGSSRHFVLSGLVVHESIWHTTLSSIIDFRRALRTGYGLKLREEIHAAHFIHHPGALARLRKDMRLRILREVLDFQAKLPDINIVNVCIDKNGKRADFDVFEWAWKTLIQRFENTIKYCNFPGPKNPKEQGMLFVDRTDEKKLRNLSRRMRRYNPVPLMGGASSRTLNLETIIEDPVHKDSRIAYFTQLADVNAYFLYQKHCPNSYIRKKGARNWFDRLNPVLCLHACRTDPQGIFRM
jgi:hypothetical protein